MAWTWARETAREHGARTRSASGAALETATCSSSKPSCSWFQEHSAMPIMRVSYPQGALNAERKAALAKRLTDELIAMEGGAGTRGGQAFASLLMTEIAGNS